MLGLIDCLGQLFRCRGASASEAPRATGRFAQIESEFERALAALHQRVEGQRAMVFRAGPPVIDAMDRAEEKLRRKEAVHRTMRADIEDMHSRLRTGLTRADLDDIILFLQNLAVFARAGRDSYLLLPRVRHAVTERLRAEAGPMAIDRVLARLKRRSLSWPDPARYHPSATREEVEASRRRRMSDVRAAFVRYDIERIAERAEGIVWGWGGDYPERGSLLWRESVLVGVAAAIWGRLMQHFIELLHQDSELLLVRIEELIGERLPAIQAVDADTASVREVRETFASSLTLLDQRIPELGWKLVSARLPRAQSAASTEAPAASEPRRGADAAEGSSELPMSVPCS